MFLKLLSKIKQNKFAFVKQHNIKNVFVYLQPGLQEELVRKVNIINLTIEPYQSTMFEKLQILDKLVVMWQFFLILFFGDVLLLLPFQFMDSSSNFFLRLPSQLPIPQSIICKTPYTINFKNKVSRRFRLIHVSFLKSKHNKHEMLIKQKF